MAAFLTSDALSTLSISVPEWITRLDELSGTISQRQKELSNLTSSGGKPPTPSIKNKGSTESLRPRDETTPPPHPYDEPTQTSAPTGAARIQHDPHEAATRKVAVVTPPLSGPTPSPVGLLRKPSQSTPNAQARFGLRKRKTESIVTNESAQAPKYRTRSMIIVYYDSTVQGAFEDLVKYISANRNSMRKGKMNAKMDAMKRAAEQDAQIGDNEDGSGDEYTLPKFTNARSPFRPAKPGAPREPQFPNPPTQPAPIVADKDSATEADLPPLKFVSTRDMGPPRGLSTATTGRTTAGLIARNHRAGGSALEVNDIFDILDAGLEWCQGQCERAAHQFLRDGDCSDEIEGIKKRLLDVKAKSDKELERIKEEEAKHPQPPRREIKSRELRSPMMRKAGLESSEVDKGAIIKKSGALGGAATETKNPEPEKINDEQEKKKQLEADHRKLEVDMMEVDEDEGIEEDVDMTPILTFRRTRDMVR